MGVVGFTSMHAGPQTARSIACVREAGHECVVISHEANRVALTRATRAAPTQDTIFLRSFTPVSKAVGELTRAWLDRGLALDNWINVTDATTATYLAACQALGLEFPFRAAYEHCRIKPLARRLAREAGVCNAAFGVHDIVASAAPEGFLYPFVAKPMLGTGSQGVQIIPGRAAWRAYLERATRLGDGGELSIRGYRPGGQVLVEEILGGQECQIDGFVHESRLRVCALGAKTCSYSSAGFREVHGMLYRPFALKDSRQHDTRLIAWCEALLAALDFRSGTFHVEVKVNGPRISLVEINPRPGGGGNVAAIEQLSGFDLNHECIRLWLGLPPSRGGKGRRADSISFAVRYPSVLGTVERVRRPGPVKVIGGSATGVRWKPFVQPGEFLNPGSGEQYLGVLLATDACRSLDSMGAWTAMLQRRIEQPDLLVERALLVGAWRVTDWQVDGAPEERLAKRWAHWTFEGERLVLQGPDSDRRKVLGFTVSQATDPVRVELRMTKGEVFARCIIGSVRGCLILTLLHFGPRPDARPLGFPRASPNPRHRGHTITLAPAAHAFEVPKNA